MTDDRLKLHIVVNDEIIDLRQENFDRRSGKSRSPYRTTSQQLISNPSRCGLANRDQVPISGSPINGLRKLANTLYYGPSSAVIQKHKATGRAKLRDRATSADPRFRRERSPVLAKHAPYTQSDSRVLEQPRLEPKKNKTQSDPTFSINRQLQQQFRQQQQQQLRRSSIPKPSNPLAEPKIEQDRKSNAFPTPTFVLENAEEILKRDVSRRDADDKSFSLKCSGSQNLSFETLCPSIAEQSTMTEEITGTTLDCKSVYQTALTDANFTPKKQDLEIFNTTGDVCCEQPGQISPYWDDPRLIEKYAKLLKPVQVRKSKSSWTLPLATNNHAPISGARICPKCTCTTQYVKGACTYDNNSECTEPAANYEKTKTKIYGAVFKNYYLTVFFLLGSLCGLILVALVVWVLANDLLWNYLSRTQETPKYTGWRWLTAYVGGGILYAVNFVLSSLYHMIVMPRNEIFDPLKSEGTWSIF